MDDTHSQATGTARIALRRLSAVGSIFDVYIQVAKQSFCCCAVFVMSTAMIIIDNNDTGIMVFPLT